MDNLQYHLLKATDPGPASEEKSNFASSCGSPASISTKTNQLPGGSTLPRAALSLSLTTQAGPSTPSPGSGDSVRGVIAERVHRLEALLGSPTRDPSPPKNLWFYKDGLRTPHSPPPIAPKPLITISMTSTMPVRHVSTAELTVSPRTVRAHLGETDPISRSLSTAAVTLTDGHKATTSFAGASEQNDNLTRSLSSLRFSENSLKNVTNTSLPLDSSPMPPTPTFPTPQSRASFNSRTPLSPDSGISGSLRVPLNFESSMSPRLPLGKPPALPPKTPTAAAQPPPRPASKELRLDDILSMCAEYERQIEAEQREVRESMALSPPARPSTSESPSRPAPRPMAPAPETPQKDSDGGLSPSSPSATLQGPRIKTNGSLPRDGKRLPSPSRIIAPTSPLSQTSAEQDSGIFTFEKLANLAGSPNSPILAPQRHSQSQERDEVRRCGGVAMSSSALLSQNSSSTSWSTSNSASSPRTRIRTTLSRASTNSHNSSSETLKDCTLSGNPSPASSLIIRTSAPAATQFSLADYQGGKEGMMETDKNPEELYTEAKEILSLVGASPSESPSSTGGRRPPRSKHDQASNAQEGGSVPSAEAHHRLLIGTVMLSKNTTTVRSPAQMLKVERATVLTEVNRAAQELADLSLQIEEAERNADLECSLIGAEMQGNEVDVANLSLRLQDLNTKEAELAGNLKQWREKNGQVMEEARMRLEKAETELDALEESQGKHELDTDAEMDLLEKIKLKHEQLEAERKIFEDLEFRTMEEEAQMEAEIEEVSMVMNNTQKELDTAETVVSEMELQKAEITINQDVSILQERRETVASKLEAEKQKLGELEVRLRDLLATTASRRSSEDSGTITWSDEDSGKTADTVVRRGGDRKSSESTSDLPQDSTDSRSPSPVESSRAGRGQRTSSRAALATPSPSPPALQPRPHRGGGDHHHRGGGDHHHRGGDFPVQRKEQLRLHCSEEILSSGDEGRPLSGTDTASLWGPPCEGSWAGVSMRRATSSRGGQRPLTRYLPVTRQEGFDLRAHIETAGHQIELCKHIVINSCSCRGYLSKQGTRLKGWNRRWFVFDRNKRTLVYYADKSEGKAKGGIYFHSISEVYVDHQKTQAASQRATFIMKTNDRKYSLTAPSQEAMRIWVDVLFTGAEGYQEFQDLD